MRRTWGKHGRFRVVAAMAVVVGLAAGGQAEAAQDSLTADYSCLFPLIGEKVFPVELSTELPEAVLVGQPTGEAEVAAVLHLDNAFREAMRLIGAVEIEGTVKVNARLSGNNLDLPLPVSLTIPPTPIPATPGTVDLPASGTFPSLTFSPSNAGSARITVEDLALALTAVDGNAHPQFVEDDVPCTPVPGQDNVLHTFNNIGPDTGGVDFDFDIAGESFVKAANGTVPITGDIESHFDLAAGTHMSDLDLDPTTGSFTVLGFLPVTASIEFAQVGPTTGALDGGRLTSRSEMLVKLTSVKAFGILPLGGGPDCTTSTPAVVDLATPPGEVFDNPLVGGNLVGSYILPPLDAATCGALGGVISAFTAGPGNTLSLALTAKP